MYKFNPMDDLDLAAATFPEVFPAKAVWLDIEVESVIEQIVQDIEACIDTNGE